MISKEAFGGWEAQSLGLISLASHTTADRMSNGNRSGGRLTYGALRDTLCKMPARKSSLPTAALLSQPKLQSLEGDGAAATLPS